MTTAGNNEIVFYNSDDSKRRSHRRRQERWRKSSCCFSLALTPRYNSILLSRARVVVSLLAYIYSHFLIYIHSISSTQPLAVEWERRRENKCALPLMWVARKRMWFAPSQRTKRDEPNCLQRAARKNYLVRELHPPRIACRVDNLDVIVTRRIPSCQIGIVLASSVKETIYRNELEISSMLLNLVASWHEDMKCNLTSK
jgi:hypothetical protein